MYAVVKIGGHQYKVKEDQTLFVNRLNTEDEKITLEDVLLVKDSKGNVSIGKPVVEGAKVEATIVDHLKADKVIVFKKKRRKRSEEHTSELQSRGHLVCRLLL